MSINKVYVLTLIYTINWDDSDEGVCYAGEGRRILSVHASRPEAEEIKSEFNSILSRAEKERIIYPVQKASRLLKQKFGFTLHDLGSSYDSDYKLAVEPFDVD